MTGRGGNENAIGGVIEEQTVIFFALAQLAGLGAHRARQRRLPRSDPAGHPAQQQRPKEDRHPEQNHLRSRPRQPALPRQCRQGPTVYRQRYLVKRGRGEEHRVAPIKHLSCGILERNLQVGRAATNACFVQERIQIEDDRDQPPERVLPVNREPCDHALSSLPEFIRIAEGDSARTDSSLDIGAHGWAVVLEQIIQGPVEHRGIVARRIRPHGSGGREDLDGSNDGIVRMQTGGVELEFVAERFCAGM